MSKASEEGGLHFACRFYEDKNSTHQYALGVQQEGDAGRCDGLSASIVRITTGQEDDFQTFEGKDSHEKEGH